MRTLAAFALCFILAGCGIPRLPSPIGNENKGGILTFPSEGGGSSDVGSAGDNAAPDHDAAWFVGRDRAIDVCFEMAPDFGVGDDKAATIISSVFGVWAFYIHQHKIYALEWPHLQLATDHVKVRKGCDRKADLAIYLGVENDLVRKYRGQFLNPTAFIQRLSYEKIPPWGKGFIWVAKQGSIRAEPAFPNWTKRGALGGILMHEIGHTYGNEHIPGTIMAADISSLLKTEDFSNLVNIDRCRELAPCLSCLYRHSFRAQDLDGSAAAALKRILGRDVAGEGVFVLSRITTSNWGLLSVVDDRGDSELTLSMSFAPPHSVVSGLAVFKVAYGDYINSIPDVSFVQHTSIHDGQRKVGVADIETNLAACTGDDRNDHTPVSISLVEDKDWLPLADFSTRIDVEHGISPLVSTDLPPLKW